jgi:hypothetical protein
VQARGAREEIAEGVAEGGFMVDALRAGLGAARERWYSRMRGCEGEISTACLVMR